MKRDVDFCKCQLHNNVYHPTEWATDSRFYIEEKIVAKHGTLWLPHAQVAQRTISYGIKMELSRHAIW